MIQRRWPETILAAVISLVLFAVAFSIAGEHGLWAFALAFFNNGSLLISPSADRESLAKMGVRDEDSAIIKPFSQRQQLHLEFHRDRIFASPQ